MATSQVGSLETNFFGIAGTSKAETFVSGPKSKLFGVSFSFNREKRTSNYTIALVICFITYVKISQLDCSLSIMFCVIVNQERII